MKAVVTIVGGPEARPTLEAWVDRAGTLIDAAAGHPDAKALRGRGRVVVVPHPEAAGSRQSPHMPRWVVRHYHRGGAVASVLGDRYLRASTPRPLREYRLLRALEDLDVPVPRPVGAAVYPAGLFYRGDLVTEWVAGSMDLAAVLFGAAQLDEVEPGDAAAAPTPDRSSPGTALAAEAAMEAAGRLVRLLHERGVDHPDLNLKNILVAPGPDGPRALVIDLDRARVWARGLSARARRRMLTRFRRSLLKWEDRAGGATLRGMEGFRRGYGAPPD